MAADPRATVRTTRIETLEIGYDERVLAPRAWTAAQSAWARELLPDLPPGRVLELCSGVGHIGLLSLTGSERSLVMVDASARACDFARRNAVAAGRPDRVEVRHGRLEDAVDESEVFPLVLADPPWVPTATVSDFPEDPVSAIDGGADGLGPARACLTVVDAHLHEAGRCILQVGDLAQVEALRAWIAEQSTRLAILAVRIFERGVLVLLGRPGAAVGHLTGGG